ncbi:hypothetical protein K505DRAFT_332617 [Melanomma pulvis-pyrius CBS 109.77]|uniref:Uncharacterized protein n=1 Tax=Melanomma pulvis-pyrius CBS 109.77 TaxID=1314802 RepID=A0A6A6XS32_9PLEO|nr:hypothetical protein K505DRAFT_332617 [Melanomma pulvis-pyrius CBS 109.77]
MYPSINQRSQAKFAKMILQLILAHIRARLASFAQLIHSYLHPLGQRLGTHFSRFTRLYNIIWFVLLAFWVLYNTITSGMIIVAVVQNFARKGGAQLSNEKIALNIINWIVLGFIGWLVKRSWNYKQRARWARARSTVRHRVSTQEAEAEIRSLVEAGMQSFV